MSVQIVIADKDPLVALLEDRAAKRGLGPAPRRAADRKELKKKLPKLGRELLRERLMQLTEHGDPMATPAPH